MVDYRIEASPTDNSLKIDAARQLLYPGGQIEEIRQLNAEPGVKTSVIGYPSDGQQIYAAMTLPDAPTPPKGFPVVVFCHGFVNPLDYQTDGPELRGEMASLSRHGYAVLKPDYRGHGMSPGTPHGAYYSADYSADVLNLISSLRQDVRFNPKAVGLIGHSMGGYVALRAAEISGDTQATVLLAGAVGDINDMYYHWVPNSQMGNPAAEATRQQLVRNLGEPDSDPQFWDAVSPLKHVNYLNAPVQIHHGTGDDTVPYRFSEQLRDALQADGDRYELYLYPGAGHGLDGPERDLVWQRALSFLHTNLGGLE
jgi:dipeptidyl aminopeptidase/acylaminoacyl peptidase